MIVLRDVRAADSSMMHDWRNRPDVSKYMYTDHRISAEEHDRWFGGLRANSSVKYWIVERDGVGIGVANLAHLDPQQRRCSWAFYLAETERHPGAGAHVEYGVLAYVFETLVFEKLSCEVLGFNDKVVGLHEKFGFKQEGRLRRHIQKGDERFDVILLGLLKEEWEVFRGTPLARRLADGVAVAAQ